MGFDLLAFTSRLITDEASAIASLTSPLLICELPPGADEDLLFGTLVPQDDRQLPGRTVAHAVRKGSSDQNAFAFGITVGRTRNNDIVVEDNSVSRFHAYFVSDLRTGTWTLVDAESSNGTLLEEVALQPRTPTPVPDRSRVKFGSVSARFLLPESVVAYVRGQLSTQEKP
ncbi:MAG: FHA domain-containing protein [Myxococcota bacterium]|nr:FHA domain-containing protein [Myxococcota bacterium]